MNEPITMTGKYKYRNGHPARVICVDRGIHPYTVISLDRFGKISTHTIEGFVQDDNIPQHNDLIPDVPLWEREIWVHKDGRVRTSEAWTEFELKSWGFRKIKVREVEQ